MCRTQKYIEANLWALCSQMGMLIIQNIQAYAMHYQQHKKVNVSL